MGHSLTLIEIVHALNKMDKTCHSLFTCDVNSYNITHLSLSLNHMRYLFSPRSISDICRGKASNGTPYNPPSDLLVAHTQIPKGYEKKPPAIRDSNHSPSLNSVYPDIKPASLGPGTGPTPQAFSDSSTSGGICTSLQLQPSRKFLPKSQPSVTENIFSPPVSLTAVSGGFSNLSGKWVGDNYMGDV